MAFDADKITKLANLAPPDSVSPTTSSFDYVTTDTHAVVAAPNYFDAFSEFLAVGDILSVRCAQGPVVLKVATVIDDTNAHVTVTTLRAVARGQHVMVAAADTVATGLYQVAAVVASLDDDPVDGCQAVTASIGDQAGAPAKGSIVLKIWKSTDADATLVAGDTFGKKVNWVAYA